MSVRLTVLQHIRDGKAIDGLVKNPTAYINRLVREGLVKDAPTGLELTPNGLALLPVGWEVQQMHYYRIDGVAHVSWVPIRDLVTLDTLIFPEREQAEQDAKLRSVMDKQTFRVIQTRSSPASFTVFVFGERYNQDMTGAMVKAPLFNHDVLNKPLIEEIPYVVQKRIVHTRNDGHIAPWELASHNLFFGIDEATEAAESMSAADTDAYEYRVWYHEIKALSPVVFCRGSARPDVGLLDALALVGEAAVESDDPRERKVLAVEALLTFWGVGKH